MALKGTTTIELTNVKTGKVERYVEHNMVTNALSEILRPIGYLKGDGPHYNVSNLCHKYLGGMVLFDKPIPENANQLYAPGGVTPIGYGAYNYVNNTTDNALGSYNLTESERNTYSRYMKYVFDFTTSQANGNINCIALTHFDAGRYTGYGSETHLQSNTADLNLMTGWSRFAINSSNGRTKYDGYAYGNYEHIFLVDTENDIVYYFGVVDSSTVRITRRRGNIRSIPVVVDHSSSKELIDTFDISLPSTIPTTYVSWNYDHYDDCLYICSASATTVTTTGSFTVTKIAVNDWSVTQYTITNATGTTLATQYSRFAYVHEGYVYVKNSGNTVVYRIKLDDPSVEMALSGTVNSSAFPQIAVGGRVYYEYTYNSSSYGYLYIADGNLGVVSRPTANALIVASSYTYSFTAIRNDPFHWLHEDSYLCYLKNYLGTINNLSRTIEKTSDKTMKITYTIQEM